MTRKTNDDDDDDDNNLQDTVRHCRDKLCRLKVTLTQK